ncbi:MAG: hypothetical protein V7629_09130 [Motiliproteus sp.]
MNMAKAELSPLGIFDQSRLGRTQPSDHSYPANQAYNKQLHLAGKITRHRSRNPLQLDYYLYVPSAGGEGAPVMVAVHGVSRNASAQVRLFAPLAERYGVVVIAPIFSTTRFPAYQRLGLRQAGLCSRPDEALDAVVDQVGELTGARTEHLSLFGYSGGGQFVHRYAMFHPERVHSVSMGAPGWYTFPDPRRAFPQGIRAPKGFSGSLGLSAELFEVPMAVFVGAQDTQRDRCLKTSAGIDAQQGAHRLERGWRWVQEMQAAACEHGYGTRYEFQILDDCGHSFQQCMQRGKLGQQVFDFMLGRLRRPLAAVAPSGFVMFKAS